MLSVAREASVLPSGANCTDVTLESKAWAGRKRMSTVLGGAECTLSVQPVHWRPLDSMGSVMGKLSSHKMDTAGRKREVQWLGRVELRTSAPPPILDPAATLDPDPDSPLPCMSSPSQSIQVTCCLNPHGASDPQRTARGAQVEKREYLLGSGLRVRPGVRDGVDIGVRATVAEIIRCTVCSFPGASSSSLDRTHPPCLQVRVGHRVRK